MRAVWESVRNSAGPAQAPEGRAQEVAERGACDCAYPKETEVSLICQIEGRVLSGRTWISAEGKGL